MIATMERARDGATTEAGIEAPANEPRNGVDAAAFESLRSYLFAIAYRMLGSAIDAEDVVQDAWLRLAGRPEQEIRSPKAYASAVVTRLCLDRLAAVRTERQTYHGPWLPEPVPSDDVAPGPELAAERRDDISLAFLVLLERLTPDERAAYVLREAFDYPYQEIAHILDKSVPAVRQIAHRARAHLADRPRFVASPDDQRRLAERFLRAARQGDLPALTATFAADITSWADGGSRVLSARRPLHGADTIGRWLIGLEAMLYRDTEARLAAINGGVGVVRWRGGDLIRATVIDVAADGRIQALRVIVNPDKLAYLQRRLA
ncbi:MAG TPA: RNA polymerase sigma factor SigJ, partial [Thermomicrobiales bacterium]|nr:RNA polymerase sigma factor SigJ [Thermomicrobiales bacterium]